MNHDIIKKYDDQDLGRVEELLWRVFLFFYI